MFNPVLANNNGGLGDFNSLLLSSQNYQGLPPPSGFGITLNDSDFKTEAVIVPLCRISRIIRTRRSSTK